MAKGWQSAIENRADAWQIDGKPSSDQYKEKKDHESTIISQSQLEFGESYEGMTEQWREVGIVGGGVVPQPQDVLDALRKLANKLPNKQCAEVNKVIRIQDSRDRDLAFTRLAGRYLTQAIRNLETAAKLSSSDPLAGRITGARKEVKAIHNLISKTPRSSAAIAPQATAHAGGTVDPTEFESTGLVIPKPEFE